PLAKSDRHLTPPLPRNASAGGRLIAAFGQGGPRADRSGHRLEKPNRHREKARIGDFKGENSSERKNSSPQKNLLFKPSGPSRWAFRMMRGRSRGGRAETPVSTLLVLVAILTVLAPIAEATMSPPGPRAAPTALLP